ncbi:MAG TPA: DNA-3-methyladenine glycosylase I [Verrucomicrobiae bacterium]|nr:DNA-3-methyladenine glycosylase I [Verrucomicrobiae bacterium]
MKEIRRRCPWPTDDLYVRYHDEEWGVPVHDDRRLFEFLILEGAQAGLSWRTVLNKRENYRKAFDHFDAEKIARYGQGRIKKLMNNEGIIRNRMKIESAIQNARAFLEVREEFGSFDAYQWRFVEGRPVINHYKTMRDVPARTKLSDSMSKDLITRGFKFVGSTICYAHMQAVGMVNDHLITCFRHQELS